MGVKASAVLSYVLKSMFLSLTHCPHPEGGQAGRQAGRHAGKQEGTEGRKKGGREGGR